MKNIIKYLSVACFALLVGCNDAIDIRQPGLLDAGNAFKTVDDLGDGLLGVMTTWDNTREVALSSIFTDEISIGSPTNNGGQGIAVYNLQLNSAGAESTFWISNLVTNNRATVLIEAANGLSFEGADDAARKNIVGQVHAIRAYANFELLTYYSPNLRDNSALGIPVVDFVAPLNYKPLRNTVGESFDYILSDIAAAKNLITDQSSLTFVSRDFVRALEARISAFRGDYATTATLAQSLLSAYPIANRADYQDMFSDASNAEIIFKLERTINGPWDNQPANGSIAAGGWVGGTYAFIDATFDGGAFFEMDRKLFSMLDPADIRYDVCVAPSSLISPDPENAADYPNEDVIVIAKHPGDEGVPLMNDLKIFRSSEMLLLLAEARAAQNNLTGAASLIKQLRDARFGSPQVLPSYGSQAEAFGAILDERRIEFAFEGHRYKDLKRLGTAGNRGIDRSPLDCGIEGAPCTLPASDYRFTLAIPLAEINGNPAISSQQNPGY